VQQLVVNKIQTDAVAFNIALLDNVYQFSMMWLHQLNSCRLWLQGIPVPPETPAWIVTLNTSNDVVLHKEVPFEGYKN